LMPEHISRIWEGRPIFPGSDDVALDPLGAFAAAAGIEFG